MDFPNKTSALSFKNKLDLLTDLKEMKKEDSKKFQVFAEIRNQFAYNSGVTNFTSCFMYLDGTENQLNKLYPKEAKKGFDRETTLELQVRYLYADLMNVMVHLFDRRTEHFEERSEEFKKTIFRMEVLSALENYSLKDFEFGEKYRIIIAGIQYPL